MTHLRPDREIKMLRTRLLLFLVAIAVEVTACGDGSVLSVDVPASWTVTKLSGDRQAAAVNTAVAISPSVQVTGADGRAISGVAVVFGVLAGDGSVTVSDATTDPDGIATSGKWVLGKSAGLNSLSASVPGHGPIVFYATGLAGPATGIVKVWGDNQGGDVTSPVTTLPTVAVRDTYGNPVGGVTVTFSVTSGGGEILGATPATDSTGMARVLSWTLGPEPGPNTLEANVAGLVPATFTAVAVDRCTSTIPYALGSSVGGTLASGGCRLWGEFTNRYSFSASDGTSIRLDMMSYLFSPHVSLFNAHGELLASSPYYCAGYCDATNAVRVLLAPGDYIIGAGGFTYDYDDNPVGGVAGAYSLSSAESPEDVRSCGADAPMFIVPGVTTTQRIETTDCVDSFVVHSSTYTFFYDRIGIYLTAGRTYTISMSSADFDTYLELWSTNPYGSVEGRVEFSDGSGDSSDARITFTPTWSGPYVIRAATHASDTTGTYTLTVE